jgi:type I restriction enzyme S subunit
VSIVLEPLASHVLKIKLWNPANSVEQDEFDYIDLSSVDKEKKEIVIPSVQRIVPSDAPSRARQLVNRNDVLVATVRPNLNGIALVQTELDGATASTGYCILRANNKTLNSKFLYYWVQTKYFINDMMSKATGANYPAVSDRIIKESRIPLPPLAEQKRIAAILDKADAIRRKRQQAIQLADEFLRSVFLDMFGDPVSNPKYATKKFSEFSTLQQGLQISIKNRKNEPGKSRFKYLNIRYLNRGTNAEYIENPRSSVICKKEDILMTRTGNTGQVVTGVEGVFHNNFFRIDYDRHLINSTYLIKFLEFPNIKKKFLKLASTTTIPDLNHSDFLSVSLPIPPHDKQEEFSRIVKSVNSAVYEMTKGRKESAHLFDALSQKAFKGEL